MVLPFENMDYGEDQIGARNIPELSDVLLTNLANGEILKYNSTSEKWENEAENATMSLDNLTDTNITTPITNGSSLIYNTSNSKWENSLLVDNNTDNLVDLTDTNISSVANGELLKYNSSNSKWENSNLLINEINDVNITSLQNGEVLKYNSTSGKWENQDNTDTLNELTDVTLTSSSNNQVLKYNGSIWVNNFVNLTELADTNISTLNNGDILRYNSVSQKWETDTFNINDLDDVNITSVANNEVLKYNSTSGKWENSNRIDTLDELGDVALTSVTTGDLLRYNGSNFVNTKIAFDNDFTNVNFTSLTNGDLIKYDGSNFINFAPTYLDGGAIFNDFLIKVVNGQTVQTSYKETSVLNTSTTLQTFISLGGGLLVTAGSIETEFFNTTKKRMHLTTSGIASTNGITITSDGRVGIGVVEPEEDLEVDGNIQLDTGGVQRGRVIFYDKQNNHEHAEVDGLGEGTNGGVLAFYTKVDGGSVTEKIRISNTGAIGIGGVNYGTSGQVIVSNGSGSSVSWADQTDTTYTAGTGMSLVGTTFNNTAPDQIVTLTQGGSTTITGTYPNFTISSTDTNTTYTAGTGMSLVGTTFAIGQSVAVSDSPEFTQLTIGSSGVSQGILNFDDNITTSFPPTIAQIKGIKEDTDGGVLSFHTKVDGGSLTERLRIDNDGAIGIGGANYGTSGQVLTSNGSGNAPSWNTITTPLEDLNLCPTEYSTTSAGVVITSPSYISLSNLVTREPTGLTTQLNRLSTIQTVNSSGVVPINGTTIYFYLPPVDTNRLIVKYEYQIGFNANSDAIWGGVITASYMGGTYYPILTSLRGDGQTAGMRMDTPHNIAVITHADNGTDEAHIKAGKLKINNLSNTEYWHFRLSGSNYSASGFGSVDVHDAHNMAQFNSVTQAPYMFPSSYLPAAATGQAVLSPPHITITAFNK